jgi:hypothetical protein
MGPRNAYKDMLDNVISPIACVDMNHQNQLEQMANGAMFAAMDACKYSFLHRDDQDLKSRLLLKIETNVNYYSMQDQFNNNKCEGMKCTAGP